MSIAQAAQRSYRTALHDKQLGSFSAASASCFALRCWNGRRVGVLFITVSFGKAQWKKCLCLCGFGAARYHQYSQQEHKSSTNEPWGSWFRLTEACISGVFLWKQVIHTLIRGEEISRSDNVTQINSDWGKLSRICMSVIYCLNVWHIIISVLKYGEWVRGETVGMDATQMNCGIKWQPCIYSSGSYVCWRACKETNSSFSASTPASLRAGSLPLQMLFLLITTLHFFHTISNVMNQQTDFKKSHFSLLF